MNSGTDKPGNTTVELPQTWSLDPWEIKAARSQATTRSGVGLRLALALLAGPAVAVTSIDLDSSFPVRTAILALASSTACGVAAFTLRWTLLPLLALVALPVAIAAQGNNWVGENTNLVLLGIASTTSATLAWASKPRSATRRGISGLAVGPWIVAQGLVLSGGPAMLVPILLAVAAVVGQLAGRTTALDHLDHRLSGLLRTLGDWVAAAMMLILTMPTLYLPAALIARSRQLRRRSAPAPTTAWHARGIPVDIERRDALWLFCSTSRPVRNKRTALAAVATTLLVAFALAVTPKVDLAPSGTGLWLRLDQASLEDFPAMGDAPWTRQLQEEIIDPEERGELVTVSDDGERRTIAPPSCGCPEATLLLTGGSAAWGWAQRDEHTIASALVRLAADDGIALTVHNFGSPGSTMQGELHRIDQLLRGRLDADILLVYAGFNDVMTNATGDFRHGPDSSRGYNMPYDDVAWADENADAWLAWDGGRGAGRRAADRMAASADDYEAVAKDHGAVARFVFQADAIVDATQLRGYDRITGISIPSMLSSSLADALDTASTQLEGRFLNLRSLFVDYPRPVFVGIVHHNEEGARVVARALYESLRDDIRSAAGAP